MIDAGLDQTVILLIGAIVLAMIATFGVVAYALLRASKDSHRRRRLAMVAASSVTARTGDKGGADRGASATRRRAVQQRLKELEEQRKRTRRKVTLRADLQQAGLRMTVRTYFVVSFFVGIFATLIYLYLELPLLGAPPVFLAGFLGIPRLVVKRMARRRRDRFTFLFADAVDVIVRGVQSGLPVNECLNIIARESPEPVGGEFRQVVEGIKIGLTLNETMVRALDRMPTAELKFFAVVLSIQQQTGGNLAETLSNLSGVLRDRKRMADKIKAMTAEARMTAMIIGSLPFVISGLLALVSPNYVGILINDPMGHYLIGAGIGMMGVGVLVMNRMIAFEY